MTTIRIREARGGDAQAIRDIYAASVENETASWETVPPDVTEMNRRIGSITGGGYPYLVAEEEGTDGISGFAYAGPFRDRAAYAWSVEDSIYVAEGMRGRGIGSALLSALIERCEALGYRQMVAVLGDSGGGSRALHARHGFEEAGRLPDFGWKHGAWRELLLMQRPLGAGGGVPPDPA